jgi:hypothetical protein
MQFKGHKQNTSSQIQNIKHQTEQTRTNIARKREWKVLGQNPYTLKLGNKSLIKAGLELNIQLSLLMPLAAEAHLV